MNNREILLNQNFLLVYFDKFRTRLWFWILIGISVMYIFFMIAQNLIIIIGGFFLGIYLYNFFNKNKNNLDEQII